MNSVLLANIFQVILCAQQPKISLTILVPPLREPPWWKQLVLCCHLSQGYYVLQTWLMCIDFLHHWNWYVSYIDLLAEKLKCSRFMPSAMFDTLGVRSKDFILQHLFLSWCMLGTDTHVRPRCSVSSVARHLTFHAQKLQFAEYICENLSWLLAVNLCNLVARLQRWLRGYKPGTCCESLWLCSIATAEKE